MTIVMSMNKYHHVENHDNHHHIHVNSHEIATEQSVFHYLEHMESHKNIGVLGSTLLLLVFFRSIGFNYILLLRGKVIQLRTKITFYQYIFVDPPPTLLRSILFHAPPQ